MDLVSVIIPLYKSEPYLRRTLDSVLVQTTPQLEVLCVDDCSPDGSADIVREYAAKDSRVKLLSHRQNSGSPAFGRNTGLAAATGTYVTFLDHDDTFLPTKLEELVTAMEREKVDFICSNCLLVNAATGKPDMSAWGLVTGNPRKNFARRLLQDNFVPPNSTLIRRSALEKVGGFDTALRGVDDFDLWYRLARVVPSTVLDKPLCTWSYRNGSSISADTSLMLRDEIAFYEKIAALPDATAEERQVAQERIIRDRRRLANRLLLGRSYREAAQAYAQAGSHRLAAATRLAAPLLRALYKAKLRSRSEFQPIALDFGA